MPSITAVFHINILTEILEASFLSALSLSLSHTCAHTHTERTKWLEITIYHVWSKMHFKLDCAEKEKLFLKNANLPSPPSHRANILSASDGRPGFQTQNGYSNPSQSKYFKNCTIYLQFQNTHTHMPSPLALYKETTMQVASSFLLGTTLFLFPEKISQDYTCV